MVIILLRGEEIARVRAAVEIEPGRAAGVGVARSGAEDRPGRGASGAHRVGRCGGAGEQAICAAVGADTDTVGTWRRRFAAHRLDGLLDEPRPGTPRQIGDDGGCWDFRVRWGGYHWSGRGPCEAFAEQRGKLGLGHEALTSGHGPPFLGPVQHQEQQL